MKKSIQNKSAVLAVALGLILALSLAGCSDDAPQQAAQQETAKSAHPSFDHAHGAEVTDLEKHKFEHEFAEQCVAREMQNSVNKDIDRKRFEEACMCIAQYMMKDLTAVEAKKFLAEHKNTQSLRIRYENAAYHCVQQKAQPKSPAIFGKR